MKGWFKRLFQASHKAANPVYYFTHIPKTAGTSFIVLLDRFCDARKIYPHQLWREAKDIDVEKNRDYDLFRGHFGGGGVNVLTQRPIEYLTILRNPTSLALSTYQFVKREQNTKVHQLVVENNMSFADFLQHPVTAPLVKNRMVRNISFDFIKDPAAQEVFLSAETIAYLQTIISQQKPAISDVERLKRSKSFIDACLWFGLLERFDESLQLLCFVMKWPPMGSTQKLNTYQKKVELTQQEIEVLNQVNQQDNELYQYATVIFEQKIKKMHDVLEKTRVSDEQSIDELLDLNYQQHRAKHQQSIKASFRYDFLQPLLGSQWHRREMLTENDSFRWTGPAAFAFIDFWVKPQDYLVTIRIINATSSELLNNLQISINGELVDWQSAETGVVRELNISCSKDLIDSSGLLRLGFKCQKMISHQQAFDSGDDRLVGVAVNWIEFKHEG